MPHDAYTGVEARHVDGNQINALRMTREQRRLLQETYALGDLSDRFICVEGWWTLDTNDVMMERIREAAERATTAILSMSKKLRR